MTQTVIGVFDTRDTAYAAGDALIDQGIDESSIYLSAKKGTKGAGQKGQSMEAIRGFLSDLFGPENPEDVEYFADEIERGSVLLSADVPDNVDIEPIREALQSAGAVDMEVRRSEQSTGSTGSTGDTVQVVEETMDVGKKKVGKGTVRVVSRMVETPVKEDVTLREEYATIKRRPMDQPVSPEEVEAMGDETIEGEETAEKAVVGKSARIVEEVEVGKETSEKVETIEGTERHTEVDVERESGETTKRKGGKK